MQVIDSKRENVERETRFTLRSQAIVIARFPVRLASRMS